MINKNIKIVLAVVLVATAIWQFSEKYIGNGIFLLLLAAIVALLYFKNELLIAVLFKFRKQDMEGAAKLLNKINPEANLVKGQQGYYHYLKGVIAVQTNDFKSGEQLFKKAIDLGLNQKEDLAVAKLQLAGITMSKNKQAEAQKYLSEAEQLDTTGMLKKGNELSLKQKEELAVAKLQLAGITMSKNKQAEAQKYLTEAEQLDTKGKLKEQISMMKVQMKQVKGQKVPMWYNHSKKRGF